MQDTANNYQDRGATLEKVSQQKFVCTQIDMYFLEIAAYEYI